MKHHVYALCEPSTGEFRYIGRSQNPAARLGYHYKNTVSDAMDRWLASLQSPPVVKILSSHDAVEDSAAEELRVIAALGIGGRLLNIVGIVKPIRKPEQFAGIGKRYTECRDRADLTNADVHRLTGINQATLSNLQRSRRTQMKSDDLIRLCRAIGTTAEYLVTGESA